MNDLFWYVMILFGFISFFLSFALFCFETYVCFPE